MWIFIGWTWACQMLCPALSAQQIMVNNQGEKILVFPDGSWRLAVPGDSIYEKQVTPPRAADSSSSATVPAGADNETPEPWNALMHLILEEEKVAQARFRAATNAQFKAGEALRNAKANESILPADQLERFETAYALSIDQLSLARKREEAVSKVADQGRKKSSQPDGITEKDFTRLRSAFADYLAEYVPNPPALPELPAATVANQDPSGSARQPSAETSATGTYSTGMRSPCQLTRNTTDESTGLIVRETAASNLFFHTDQALRSFFKNKDLITCRARLTRSGPYTYLLLEFEIASANSKASFGGIAQGALVRLRMMDGDMLTLYNIQNDRGRIDTYTGHTLFASQYALGREDIKKLQSGELDKIRVLWLTGYEDYEVIFTDVIREQLACLMSE